MKFRCHFRCELSSVFPSIVSESGSLVRIVEQRPRHGQRFVGVVAEPLLRLADRWRLCTVRCDNSKPIRECSFQRRSSVGSTNLIWEIDQRRRRQPRCHLLLTEGVFPNACSL
jgi:hypothetical protein